jgi:hypothetical protein
MAYELPVCWANHIPPDAWPPTYPKGIAGKTIFHDIVEDPESFGWSENDQSYIAMVNIVSAYEGWYTDEMAELEGLVEDLNTEDYTEAEATVEVGSVAAQIEKIDKRFVEDAFRCRAYIPTDVWNAYAATK